MWTLFPPNFYADLGKVDEREKFERKRADSLKLINRK